MIALQDNGSINYWGWTMTEITTMNFFISLQERKRFAHRMQNVVEMLLSSLNIDPSGRQLVMACGSGDEPNNREALKFWLDKALCCESRLDAFTQEQIVQALNTHLQRCIGHWSD